MIFPNSVQHQVFERKKYLFVHVQVNYMVLWRRNFCLEAGFMFAAFNPAGPEKVQLIDGRSSIQEAEGVAKEADSEDS